MKKWLPLIIPLGLIVLIGLWSVSVYNNLVSLREEAKTAWSQVQNQYQRRADLIPNLVATVKGYASQERNVLEEVTRLRSQWGAARQSGSVEKQFQAARGLDAGLSRLLLVVENYPQLKSNENFLALQDQLEGTENRISVERRRYNLAVLEYNRRLLTYPGRFFLGFGFQRMPLFESQPGTEKPPVVKF